ncbi:homologous-pairing protein 2 homolog [Uloborus diversus]|uniref:homologous-pairing protein 2 homolog n=1 Tax=Uloborus diversus TaxID=327109 RepID=UPI00240A64CF|nr:homologous-pairing protein 2 homolog [Uloborus diversus]
MSNAKESNAVKQVFDYLVTQNRPYSALDIVNNLHKEHGKTAVQRALDYLVSKEKIKEKSYGKQKIYFPNQAQFSVASDADIQAYDAEIIAFTDSSTALCAQIKEGENKLLALNKSLTTEAAVARLNELKSDIPKLKQKLDSLENNSVCISNEEKEAVCVANKKYKEEWQKRKRMAVGILDAILESYPHGRAKLLEEIGIESEGDLPSNKKLKV